MRYLGIVFDKDGTLFDFRATWTSWASASLDRLSEGDGGLREKAAKAIDFDDLGGFSPESVVIAGTVQDIVAALSPIFPGRNDIANVLNQIASDTSQVPVAELVATLKLLSQDHVLGLATNDAEASARSHLEQYKISGFFDFIAGYDSGYGGKPAPGQLLEFCRVRDLRPENVVMVGDSLHDLKAGRSAGMATVGVLTGLALEDDLAGWADAVLPDISYLPNWLSKQAS